MNFVKDEYIIIITNILSPLLFQGFQSIYETALSYKKKNNVNIDELRIFQDLLRSVVPNWNKNTIEQEVKRIKILSRNSDYIEDIYKMIIKSYIIFLVGKTNEELDRFCEQIDFKNFIHKSYIYSAREIFNNPFLFTGGNPREIKNNQKEIINLIKESIKNAIREILPMGLILKAAQNINVNLLPQENPSLQEKPSTLLLEHKTNDMAKPIPKNTHEISLLSSEGGNIMDKVFSNYNIVENKPHLVQEDDVVSVVQSEKVPSTLNNHTLTNFLKQDEAPIDLSEIKQSINEEFDDVFDNNKLI